ncbi:hypothetical protein FRX31_003431 [Thalictrum thalictroides]|uniref:DUF4283 domain-containing protein n=1 Tax=Thalictrum thalictroides TaxID=46969 RepID=A0A7J6XEY2_THATH|nr:hypothetical protein FRX31_003431 [Thalictrum thalictroides]
MSSPWFIKTQLVRFIKWSPNFSMEKHKLSSALIWVRFPGLSMEYWEPDILLAMARTIGLLVQVDKNTLDRDMGYYGSVQVDVDLAKTIPDKI